MLRSLSSVDAPRYQTPMAKPMLGREVWNVDLQIKKENAQGNDGINTEPLKSGGTNSGSPSPAQYQVQNRSHTKKAMKKTCKNISRPSRSLTFDMRVKILTSFLEITLKKQARL